MLRINLFFLATGDAPSFLGLPGPRFGGPPIEEAKPPREIGMSATRDKAPSDAANPNWDPAVVVVVPVVLGGPEDDRDISLEFPDKSERGDVDVDNEDDCCCCSEFWGITFSS